MTLDLEDGFQGQGDTFYEALIAAHAGLTEKESAAFNARLVLILANQVGNLEVLLQALDAAGKRNATIAPVDRTA